MNNFFTNGKEFSSYNYFWQFFFQMELIYPNGTKLPAKKVELLREIPSNAANDRLFINSTFVVFFTEKRMRKHVKNGLTCPQVLEKFRNSSKYKLMQDMYEYRVLNDENGDVRSRTKIFGNTFRVKLNNWWRTNAKIAEA